MNGSEARDLEEALERFSRFLKHRTKRVRDDVARLLTKRTLGGVLLMSSEKPGFSAPNSALPVSGPSLALTPPGIGGSDRPSAVAYVNPGGKICTSTSATTATAPDSTFEQFGGQASGYHAARAALLRELQTQARQVGSDSVRDERAAALIDAAGRALSLTAAPLAGSLGVLGGCWAAAMLDWTGLLSASLLAVTGLAALPYRRRELQKDMDSRLHAMRRDMQTVVGKHFREELDHTTGQLQEVMHPFQSMVAKHAGTISNRNFKDMRIYYFLQKYIIFFFLIYLLFIHLFVRFIILIMVSYFMMEVCTYARVYE